MMKPRRFIIVGAGICSNLALQRLCLDSLELKKIAVEVDQVEFRDATEEELKENIKIDRTDPFKEELKKVADSFKKAKPFTKDEMKAKPSHPFGKFFQKRLDRFN